MINYTCTYDRWAEPNYNQTDALFARVSVAQGTWPNYSFAFSISYPLLQFDEVNCPLLINRISDTEQEQSDWSDYSKAGDSDYDAYKATPRLQEKFAKEICEHSQNSRDETGGNTGGTLQHTPV